jgi:hypothetical protein
MNENSQMQQSIEVTRQENEEGSAVSVCRTGEWISTSRFIFRGRNMNPGYIITRDDFTGSSGNDTQNRYLYRLTPSHIIKPLKHLPVM